MSTAHFAAQQGNERARLALAVAASPRNPDLRRQLADTLAEAGEAKAALTQYRALLSLTPKDADAAADAGLVAKSAGLEEEALPLLRAAANANPLNPRLWQVLGVLHRSLEQSDPAVEAFAKAAELDPRNPRIAHGLARCTWEAGRPAVKLYERAQRLAPLDRDLLLGHAAALCERGRAGEAIALLASHLHQHPDWVAGHQVLSRLRWAEGERNSFTASFEKALRAAPRDLSLWRELIIALLHANRFSDVLDAIRRGRAAAGPDLMFDVNEAVCAAEMGEVEKADRLFSAIGQLDDSTVTVRHVRHLLFTGRPEQALALMAPLMTGPSANDLWPYVSVAWRMLGDKRWEWLEGDPRFVGVYDIAEAIGSIDHLAELLRSLHVAKQQPLEQSVRGGTQTDGPLLARAEPEIRQLRAAIVDAVKAHVAALPPHDPNHPLLKVPRSPIRFSGSWSVRLQGQGHHANHIHPAGWLSSAFYVALPGAEERGAAHAGWLALGEPQAELGVDLPPVRLIEPKPGRLALFPSTMWHGTVPFERGERLTVAFDVARPPG